VMLAVVSRESLKHSCILDRIISRATLVHFTYPCLEQLIDYGPLDDRTTCQAYSRWSLYKNAVAKQAIGFSWHTCKCVVMQFIQ
jgi:hypothetical protein